MEKLLELSAVLKFVSSYIDSGGEFVPLQEILDSNMIPRLKGYIVRPGKVSDSVFGGKGNYLDKKTGKEIEFENPPLDTRDGTPIRIMGRTRRISTHDIVRGEIPFKDQVLALNHNYMRKMIASAIGTSQFEIEGLSDSSNVIVAENLKQIGFENVLRAYMAKSSTETSLYQYFMKGKREFCGHKLPNNLIPNGPLPYIMDTPSTKSDISDESVSPDELFKRGICTPDQYAQIRNSSIYAFGMASNFLRQNGIILVDTKFEHGINKKGKIVSQDELLTMDSSRFWLSFDYGEQMKMLNEGYIDELNPKSYSKEFARGFSKGDKGYTDEEIVKIAGRYIMGIQNLLGKRFDPDLRPGTERTVTGINLVLDQLVE